jgi:predicted DNA-binding antitoxin AbrB/MazE fold protein
MPITCDAIVENGLLRPLTDLGLTDSQRVRLTVEPLQQTRAATRGADALLLQGGLFRLPAAEASSLAGRDVAGLSVDDISQCLPIAIKGKPLSATVIEERNESW